MNKTKRVLIIAYNDLNKSGVPNVIYQIIKSLYEYCTFDIMIYGNDLYYYDQLKKEGFNNINIIKFGNSYRIKDTFNYYKKALKFFENNKYDIVHSFLEYKSYPFFKAAKKCGIKQRIYHSNINKRKEKLIGKIGISFLRKKSIKYSTDLVGVSKQCCTYSFKNNKYFVINNPYDDTLYNKSIKNELDDNKLVLTQVATFNSNKNQLFSLQVINELRKINSNVKLKLIGCEKEKGYLGKINKYILDNNIENFVNIIDGSENIPNQYKTTSFVIIPSKSEGFSLVAIEAQACGIIPFLSDAVPHDVNPFNYCIYLNLNEGPKYWAKIINSKFKEIKNNRFEFPNNNPFAKTNFKKKLLDLYKI